MGCMRSTLLATTFAGTLGVAALLTAVQPAPAVSAASTPNDDKAIVHMLNRLGFGPRPGDVEKVRAMGTQAYIEQQLRPDRLSDAAMEARLAEFSTLGMTSREIAEKFALPAAEARRQQQAANPGETGETAMAAAAQREAARVLAELSAQKMLRAVYSDRQLQEVLTDFWFNHFNVDARKGQTRFMLTEYERDVIRPHVLGKFRDLLEATAKSPAMLMYLDNWMSADPAGPHLARQAQPRRRGRGGVSPPAGAARSAAGQQNRRRGLNENYGRELMELHTLGVDGGYTQKDVTEVARAFTGWTIQNPQTGGGFAFDPRFHDPGQKVVLGHVIKAGGGERDGEEVLDMLARHPSTARFIATKLARRFVSDTPPDALVDRVAARFTKTNGDLRQVMQTLLTSPEFFSPDAYRAKVKTPFEFVVSAVRASGADVPNALLLVRAMQQLGMPLYQCQPPTGYKDTADAWVNTGALVNRMNFALQLAGGDSRPRDGLKGGPAAPSAARDGRAKDGRANDIITSVLNNDISDTTRDTIAKATTPQQMVALTLGSPEFQRR